MKHAGTQMICTACACHRPHYAGEHCGDEALHDDSGWYYCDRKCEVEDIPTATPLSEKACHWYVPGPTTHQTPEVGPRQALCLFWKPGRVHAPESGPDPLAMAKRKVMEELLTSLREGEFPQL